MPAYLIAEHIVTDAAKFEEYRSKVGPMMAKYGARYLTKGLGHKMPEGGHSKPERVVIIEFPDVESVNAWYNSAEYQPLIVLRKAATSDQDMLFILEGAWVNDSVAATSAARRTTRVHARGRDGGVRQKLAEGVIWRFFEGGKRCTEQLSY